MRVVEQQTQVKMAGQETQVKSLGVERGQGTVEKRTKLEAMMGEE